MKIIIIDGIVHLGVLEEDKNKIVVKDSICLGAVTNVTKSHLAQYLKAKNVNNLDKDVVIRGNGASVQERELSEDLVLELEILEKQMERAKKLAPGELENKKFSELVGG